ncbi:MAG TPA: hypothetical protein VGR08_13940, partial [Thermomicrobiales bacterium]|nr:hypothetical protein [Thermomicrobiales bacterium]
MAYRPDYHSPYAAPYRAPRWPWVFASILLLAVIAASTILVAGQSGPDDDLRLAAVQQSPVAGESNATETPAPTPTYTPVPTATSVDLG